MAALRIVQWERPAELVEVPVPDPGPGQVRVRVAGCGLCHSDLTMAAMPASMGEALGWRVPFTLGHETAGWIDAVGPGVEGLAGLAEGDEVALAAPASCGRCRSCLAGLESACTEGYVGRGYGRDGGLAEYVLVDDPGRALLPLGTLDPAEAGPLTDAGATSHHAVARVARRVRPGGAVLVVGVGGLGAFVVQLASLLTDARVVAVDPNPARRELAVELGADDVLDGVGPGTSAEVRALLGATPIDGVVDLVGTDDTLRLATSVLGVGGSLAVVGAAGGKVRRPIYGGLPADAEVWTFQGSDLADARAVLDLAADGRLRVDVDPYPLSAVQDAYEAMEAGTLRGRAVVRPDPVA
ncbi:MAG: alcohol dehydrogenase catalytic domain-containing protein [Actinobacteria bacterium]|nr:alcohol dehydrogenase catalytic domain-containing protein [Actinomycetota bacterium]